jgi:hypothetical protein
MLNPWVITILIIVATMIPAVIVGVVLLFVKMIKNPSKSRKFIMTIYFLVSLVNLLHALYSYTNDARPLKVAFLLSQAMLWFSFAFVYSYMIKRNYEARNSKSDEVHHSA